MGQQAWIHLPKKCNRCFAAALRFSIRICYDMLAAWGAARMQSVIWPTNLARPWYTNSAVLFNPVLPMFRTKECHNRNNQNTNSPHPCGFSSFLSQIECPARFHLGGRHTATSHQSDRNGEVAVLARLQLQPEPSKAMRLNPD